MESEGKLTLMYDSHSDVYRIGWEFDDDTGGYLGQSPSDGRGPAPRDDREAWEHWAASKAVLEAPNPKHQRDQQGFLWESKASAAAAFQLAKTALKMDRAMPAWAVLAIQNGWAPPRGWKP